MDDALIRELSEDEKREQLQKLWARYGSVALVLAVVIVLIVAIAQGWTHYRRSQQEASGLHYHDAMQQMQQEQFTEAASTLSALSEDATAGYAVAASFMSAEALLSDKQYDEAMTKYQEVAGNPGLVRHSGHN